MRYNNEWLILLFQLQALIKKRFIYFSRDMQGLSCQLFVPIILFIIGYLMTTIKMIKDPPALVLNQDVYPYQFKVNNLFQDN